MYSLIIPLFTFIYLIVLPLISPRRKQKDLLKRCHKSKHFICLDVWKKKCNLISLTLQWTIHSTVTWNQRDSPPNPYDSLSGIIMTFWLYCRVTYWLMFLGVLKFFRFSIKKMFYSLCNKSVNKPIVVCKLKFQATSVNTILKNLYQKPYKQWRNVYCLEFAGD